MSIQSLRRIARNQTADVEIVALGNVGEHRFEVVGEQLKAGGFQCTDGVDGIESLRLLIARTIQRGAQAAVIFGLRLVRRANQTLSRTPARSLMLFKQPHQGRNLLQNNNGWCSFNAKVR